MSQEFESCIPSIGEPHPKRKRLGSSHSPAKSLDPPGSNPSDTRQIGRPTNIYRDIKDDDRAKSNQLLIFDRIQDGIKSPKVNGGIEAKARYKSNIQKTGNTESVILRSPDVSPVQVPIEIQLHNSAWPRVSRRTYKGTARMDPSITPRPGSAFRETSHTASGEKSKYFRSDSGAETQSRTKKHRGLNGGHDTMRAGNLSSDELDSGTTVGNRAVVNLVSSRKRSRSTSPAQSLASTLNALLPKDNCGGLAPSTIPNTIFQTKKKQQIMSPAPISVDHKKEESESWGMELSSIVGKDSIFIKGPDLGLDFNSNYQIYQVQLQGKKQGPNHLIDPKCVQRVIFAKDGTKMRFEFSSNKKIDVEMLKKSDVSLLLRHMTTHRLHQIERSRYVNPLVGFRRCNSLTFQSVWMDKAFDRRQKENGVSSNDARRVSGDELLNTPMPKMSDHRREDAQKNITLHDEHNSKRRRPRLLDEMHGDDHQNARDQFRPEQIKSADPIDDITAANSKFLDLGLSRITERIHPHTPNPHLRGSRVELYRYARQAKQLSIQEEALQNMIQRKSVDLGAPWKKPLLFPKNGKKKASVEFSDLERLEEGEFLNDNLIGFYLRYLEQKLEETKPEIAGKVYFFNTFFFASLTNTQRGKKGINYEAVQNWTRSIDLFAFEYIVVPINESAHWYLSIICNLPTILPDFAAGKSSVKVKGAFSPHSEQLIEGEAIEAAILKSPPSSPIDKVAHTEDALSIVNKFEEEPDSGDQAPTVSFAEMSLEAEPTRGSSMTNPNMTKSKSIDLQSPTEEQGLLDAQIKDDLAHVTAPKLETALLLSEDAEEIQNEEGSSLRSNPKTHVSAKKRKRTSVAPITRRNPNSPAIITFDSLGLTHSPTIRTLKDYLREEGRAKRGLEWDDVPIKGVTAKDIPQQNNLCDCGLFLLGYVDKFLDNPKEFISKILARQYNILEDWPRLNPSTLRMSIRKQIIDLHEEQQRDYKESKESARKPDKLRVKKPHAGQKGNLNDSSRAEREEEPQSPQSPHQAPSSLRSSPKLESKSNTGMSKTKISEIALSKDTLVSEKSREAEPSPSPTPLSRERSLPAISNSRKCLTRREALERASEINAPDLERFNNVAEINYMERSGFPDDQDGDYFPKSRLLNEWEDKTSRATAHDDHPKSEEAGHLDDFYRFDSSSSVDAAEVEDDVHGGLELPRVIEDSQPDASEETFHTILEPELPTSVALGAVRRADEERVQDSHRLPPTAPEAEKQMAHEGRLTRPSNTAEHRQNSVIEID